MPALIAEYMEKGFLENIKDMFLHDPSLFAHVPVLMADDRSRVRIGTAALVETALVETMCATHAAHIRSIVPGVASLLAHHSPVIRGDAAYLLGVIGDPSAMPYLMDARRDGHPGVQEVIEEIMAELAAKAGPGGKCAIRSGDGDE